MNYCSPCGRRVNHAGINILQNQVVIGPGMDYSGSKVFNLPPGSYVVFISGCNSQPFTVSLGEDKVAETTGELNHSSIPITNATDITTQINISCPSRNCRGAATITSCAF